MHILILPSWYLTTYDSLSGIFFKEQAETLSKFGNKIGVVSISEIHHSEVWKSKKIAFNSISFNENNVNTYRTQIPYIPKFKVSKLSGLSVISNVNVYIKPIVYFLYLE